MLINLAGNGVKFTEEGGVVLSARPAEGGTIVFTVADSGPGIPAGETERLFDEFEQMEQAPSRRYGGAGLGLAISRRIVRRKGGDILFSAHNGGGSELSVTLGMPAVSGAAPRFFCMSQENVSGSVLNSQRFIASPRSNWPSSSTAGYPWT